MDKKLMLLGEEYQLKDEIKNYVKIKQIFEKLSNEYRDKYVKEVFHEEAEVKEIVEKGYKTAQKYFDMAEEVCLKILADNEVYTVAQKGVTETAVSCGALDYFEKTFSEIEETYFGVLNDAQNARNRRELRKESRGRFVGGGFGYRGAIKGIIQAEMLNTATGLGHSFVNAIGNARTEREMRKQLEELYIPIRISLGIAFESTIKNYFIVAIILLDNNNAMSFELPSEADKEQAAALIENLGKGRVPEDKIQSVSAKALMLNPYVNSVYFTVIEKCGDSNFEIEKFADAHGIDGKGIKIGLIRQNFEKRINNICEANKKSEDYVKFDNDLSKIKNEIIKYKKFIGLSIETEYENTINKEMKKIEKKYKTVDGISFKNFKDVKAAKDDLCRFYEYISVNGVESETILSEIQAIDFKTNVVTENLEERIKKMKQILDDNELGKCIKEIFVSNGFDLTVRENGREEFANKIFIIKTSKHFSTNALLACKLAKIPAEEKIILMFKNSTIYEDEFIWWVLTNCNLYIFENKSNNILVKNVIPYLDIEFIHADKNGNLITRSINGGDISTKLELEDKCKNADVCEKLTNAMQEVYSLIAPLTNGRKEKSKRKDIPKDIVELTLSSVKNSPYWKITTNQYENLKRYACVNDHSEEYNILLNEAKKYWNCDFADETIYFLIVDKVANTSIVFSSRHMYIYGSVNSNKNKYVFPIQHVYSFRPSYNKKTYAMFYDAEFFIENYFDCGYGDNGHCALHFEVSQIPNDIMMRICELLTSWVKTMNGKFVEKRDTKRAFIYEMKRANDLEKALKIAKKIKEDKILELEDRNELIKEAQKRVDKYNNSEENKEVLKQLLDTINCEDIAEISFCLKQLLSNDVFDECDRDAIEKLFFMQQRIAFNRYKSTIMKFFAKGNSIELIRDRNVYTSCNQKEMAQYLANMFVISKVVLEDEEMPLLYFESIARDPRDRDTYAVPNAKECVITNKRIIAWCYGKTFILPLEQVKFTVEDIRKGYMCNLEDERLPFGFPYIHIKSMYDDKKRRRLEQMISSDEHEIVTQQLCEFVSNIIREKEENLKKYPETVFDKEIRCVQDFLDEKNKSIKETLETLADDYQNKTETEIKDIILRLEKMPKQVTKEILPKIEAYYKSLVATREVEELVQNIEELNINSLASVIEKLKKYPSDISNEALRYVQSLLDEKCKLIKVECEDLVKDYQNKTEIEIENILLKLDEYPEYVNQDIRAKIEKRLDELINERVYKELEKLVENYRDMDIDGIMHTLSIIKRDYSNFALATEFSERLSTRLEELKQEAVASICENIDTCPYIELLQTYNELSSNKEMRNDEVLSVFKEKIILKGNDISKCIHKEIQEEFKNQKNILNLVEFLSEDTQMSFTPRYILDKVKNKNLLAWYEIPVLRVRDYISQHMIKSTGSDSLEGIIFTSHQVVLHLTCEKIVIPIQLDTKFSVKKKFLSSEICIENVNTKYSVPDECSEMQIVDFLNKVLDIIKQSDFLKLCAKEQPKVEKNLKVEVQQTQMPMESQQVQAPVGVQTQLESATKSEEITSIHRSCSEMINFVNGMSPEMKEKLIGTSNPKFRKKVTNAIKAYAHDVKEGEIFALYDDTLFGSGKDGFIMTLQGMLIKPYLSEMRRVGYSEIKGIKIVYNAEEDITKMSLVTQSGLLGICVGRSTTIIMANAINEVVKYLYDLKDVPYTVEKP